MDAPDTGGNSFASWGWDFEHWRLEQGKVPVLCQIWGYLEQCGLTDNIKRLLLPQPVKRLINRWRRLELVGCVCVSETKDSLTLETLKQVVVPGFKPCPARSLPQTCRTSRDRSDALSVALKLLLVTNGSGCTSLHPHAPAVYYTRPKLMMEPLLFP